MLNKNSTLGHSYGLNEYNKYTLGNSDYSKINEEAAKTDLRDNQIVNKPAKSSRDKYELDGTKKEEKDFLEKKEDISKKLGKAAESELDISKSDSKNPYDKTDKKSEHYKKKHDGFDKDCPLCECETCRSRRYKDESDDAGVSFQAATKMDPKTAAHMVKSHENEHVRREQYKARLEDRRIISQSVQIMMRNCPECGEPYVSGGLTRTYTKKDIDGYYDAVLNNRERLLELENKNFDISA